MTEFWFERNECWEDTLPPEEEESGVWLKEYEVEITLDIRKSRDCVGKMELNLDGYLYHLVEGRGNLVSGCEYYVCSKNPECEAQVRKFARNRVQKWSIHHNHPPFVYEKFDFGTITFYDRVIKPKPFIDPNNPSSTSKKKVDPMNLKIKTLTGKTYTLEVEKDATISDVKRELSVEFDCELDKLRLIFGGKMLEDHHRLDEEGIKEEQFLILILGLGLSKPRIRTETTTRTNTIRTSNPFFPLYGDGDDDDDNDSEEGAFYVDGDDDDDSEEGGEEEEKNDNVESTSTWSLNKVNDDFSKNSVGGGLFDFNPEDTTNFFGGFYSAGNTSFNFSTETTESTESTPSPQQDAFSIEMKKVFASKPEKEGDKESVDENKKKKLEQLKKLNELIDEEFGIIEEIFDSGIIDFIVEFLKEEEEEEDSCQLAASLIIKYIFNDKPSPMRESTWVPPWVGKILTSYPDLPSLLLGWVSEEQGKSGSSQGKTKNKFSTNHKDNALSILSSLVVQSTIHRDLLIKDSRGILEILKNLVQSYTIINNNTKKKEKTEEEEEEEEGEEEENKRNLDSQVIGHRVATLVKNLYICETKKKPLVHTDHLPELLNLLELIGNEYNRNIEILGEVLYTLSMFILQDNENQRIQTIIQSKEQFLFSLIRSTSDLIFGEKEDEKDGKQLDGFQTYQKRMSVQIASLAMIEILRSLASGEQTQSSLLKNGGLDILKEFVDPKNDIDGILRSEKFSERILSEVVTALSYILSGPEEDQIQKVIDTGVIIPNLITLMDPRNGSKRRYERNNRSDFRSKYGERIDKLGREEDDSYLYTYSQKILKESCNCIYSVLSKGSIGQIETIIMMKSGKKNIVEMFCLNIIEETIFSTEDGIKIMEISIEALLELLSKDRDGEKDRIFSEEKQIEIAQEIVTKRKKFSLFGDDKTVLEKLESIIGKLSAKAGKLVRRIKSLTGDSQLQEVDNNESGGGNETDIFDFSL